MTHSSALGTDMGSPSFSKAEVWLPQLKGSRTTVLPSRADPSSLPKTVARELQPLHIPKGLGGTKEKVASELPRSWKDSACKDLAAFPA